MYTKLFLVKNKIRLHYKSGGSKFERSTNVTVNKKSWNQDKQTVYKTDEDYKSKNEVIHAFQNKVENIIIDYYKEHSQKPTGKALVHLFDNYRESNNVSTVTLIKYFEEFLELKKIEFETKGKISSLKDYKSTLTILRLYEELKNTIHISDLTSTDWLIKFEGFLKESKTLPKDYPHNMKNGQKAKTRKKRFSVLITFMDWLNEKKIDLDSSVLRKQNTKIKVRKKDSTVVTIDELNQLINYKFSKPNHIRVVDMFITANHLGLRFGDLTSLRTSDFITRDNNTFLSKQTEKTFAKVNVPLSNTTLEILNKYKSSFPKITNQEANRYLHEALELTTIFNEIIDEGEGEISRYEAITFHTARRSFITTLINNNISVNAVMKLTGHRKISTLQGYINPDFKILKEHISIFDANN